MARLLSCRMLFTALAVLRVLGVRAVAAVQGAPLVLPPPSYTEGLQCSPSFSEWLPALLPFRASTSTTALLIFSLTGGDVGEYAALEVSCNGSSYVAAWRVSVIEATPPVELGSLTIPVGAVVSSVLTSALSAADATATAPACSWLEGEVAASTFLCLAADADGGISASAIAHVVPSPSAPVVESVVIAAGGVSLAAGSISYVPSGTLVEVIGVADGTPSPVLVWLVDSQQPPASATVSPPSTLILRVSLQSGTVSNVTFFASSPLGTASLTIFVISAEVPLLVRVPGAPLALVLGAGALVNASVIETAGRLRALSYSWYWGDLTPVAVTQEAWVLLGSGGTARAGVVSCVAHSAAGDSDALAVLHLAETALPVLTPPPPLLIAAVSGATVRIAACATGSGNTFLWSRPAPSGGRTGVLKESSATVDFSELRALPTRASSELVLRAVSMEDAVSGIDLTVSNPSGSLGVVHVAINVSAPPWGMRCAPLVLSFSSHVMGTFRREVRGLAEVRGSPFVDSAACSGAATSAPECYAPAIVVWNATILSSSSDEPAPCCLWVINSSAAFGGSRTLPISGGSPLAALLGTVALSSVECPADLNRPACHVEVVMVASVGSPYSSGAASSSSCTARSAVLPANLDSALRLPSNTSSAVKRITASRTPVPGWVLFPVPHFASVSSSGTSTAALTATLTASESLSLAASQSSSASQSPSPSSTNRSDTGAGAPSLPPENAPDALLFAAIAGLFAGILLAAGADLVTVCGLRVSAWFWVSPRDALLWLQFGVFLDLLVLPELQRVSNLVPLPLSWASGILPGPWAALLPPRTGESRLGPYAEVGLDRFAAHIGANAGSVPILVLASMTTWWAAAAGAVSALTLSAIILAPTMSLTPASRGLTRASWPGVFRACLAMQSSVVAVMLPILLASSLQVCIWKHESSAVELVSATLTLAAACTFLASTLSSRLRMAPGLRLLETVSCLVEVIPAVVVGTWPPLSHGQLWLQQGIALVAFDVIGGVAIVSLRAPTSPRRGGVIDVQFCRLLLKAAIVGSLVADANSVSAAISVEGDALVLRTFPGSLAAVALFYAFGSAALLRGLAWVVYVRQASLKASCTVRHGGSAVLRRAACDGGVHEPKPPTELAYDGVRIARIRGLDASLLGGRYLFDLSGALCYWAFALGLLRADALEAAAVDAAVAVSQHASRAVVDVPEQSPTASSPTVDGAGVNQRPRSLVVDPPDELVVAVRAPADHDDEPVRAAPKPVLVAGARVRALFVLPDVPLSLHTADSALESEQSRLDRAHASYGLVRLVHLGILRGSAQLSSAGTAAGSVTAFDSADLAARASPARRLAVEPAVRIRYSPLQPRGFAYRLANNRRRGGSGVVTPSAPAVDDDICAAAALEAAVDAAAGARAQLGCPSEISCSDVESVRQPVHSLGGAAARSGGEPFTMRNPMLGDPVAPTSGSGGWTSRAAALQSLEFWRPSPTGILVQVDDAARSNRRRHASCDADARQSVLLHPVATHCRRSSESAVASTGSLGAAARVAQSSDVTTASGAGRYPALHAAGEADTGRAPHYAFRRNLLAPVSP